MFLELSQTLEYLATKVVIVASGRGHADGFDGKLVRHKVEKIHEEPSLVVRRYCFRSNQMLAEIRKKSRNGFVSSPSLADRRDACNLGEQSTVEKDFLHDALIKNVKESSSHPIISFTNRNVWFANL